MTAKEESEELMDSVLIHARNLLTKFRGFLPYGGYMEPDGAIRHVAVDDPDNEYPGSEPLIEALQTSFQELARNRQCRAVAIVCDVRVQPPGSAEKSDAIQVSIEHIDGYAVKVFFPYSFVDDNPVYGETFVWQAERQFFVSKPE